jgi:hypothetical protein
MVLPSSKFTAGVIFINEAQIEGKKKRGKPYIGLTG